MKYFDSVRERTVGLMSSVTGLQQSQREGSRSMWLTVIGAFFVVGLVGYLLSSTTSSPSVESATERTESEWFEEAYAYQPGQFVTSQVRAGYIGR